MKSIITNIPNISKENIPTPEVKIKNQKDNPAVTARDLNLGEDVFMLNRINESYKTRLCQSSYTNQCNHQEEDRKHVEFSFFNI